MTPRRTVRTRPPSRIETSAGGVVFRCRGGIVRVLLVRDRYGHWGLPKGHVEAGETASEAALREVREETGLSELAMGRELDTIDWFFRFGGQTIHKYCHFFLVEALRGEAVPQPEEGVSECVWLSIPEAIEAIAYENAREVLRLAAEDLPGVSASAGPGPAQ
ncbi:MAG: NUDIX hydrolase [Longimicrobiaceae bacterium]